MDGSYAAEDSIRFTLTVKPNELKIQERGEECLKAVVEALEKDGEGGGARLYGRTELCQRPSEDVQCD